MWPQSGPVHVHCGRPHNQASLSEFSSRSFSTGSLFGSRSTYRSRSHSKSWSRWRSDLGSLLRSTCGPRLSVPVGKSFSRIDEGFYWQFRTLGSFRTCAVDVDRSGESKKDSIVDRVNRASELLDEIIQDVFHEQYLTNAMARVYKEEMKSESDIIAEQVTKHIKEFDQNFLAVINQFAEQAKSSGNEELGEMLDKISQEILRQVMNRLPKQLQLLDMLMETKDKTKRADIMQKAYEGSSEDIPKVDPVAIGAAANQIITEMEEQEEILDRRMLAKLCTVREEARILEMEIRFLKPEKVQESIEEFRRNVLERSMALIQNLMKIGEDEQRIAILEKAFRQDWLGERKVQSKQKRPKGMQAVGAPDPPDFVRPGGFMSSIASTQHSMDNDPNTKSSTLKRIEQIRLNAMFALRIIGWGEFTDEEVKDHLEEREAALEAFRESLETERGDLGDVVDGSEYGFGPKESTA